MPEHHLSLTLMPEPMAVVRLPATAMLPVWATSASFFSITRTPDELSILCPEENVPEGVQAEWGWRCLRVDGPLDFSLVGVLASLLNPLQEAGVSVFVLSTYDTDYILVKVGQLAQAVGALQAAGYSIRAS